jgi:hypothetical protein
MRTHNAHTHTHINFPSHSSETRCYYSTLTLDTTQQSSLVLTGGFFLFLFLMRVCECDWCRRTNRNALQFDWSSVSHLKGGFGFEPLPTKIQQHQHSRAYSIPASRLGRLCWFRAVSFYASTYTEERRINRSIKGNFTHAHIYIPQRRG